MVALLAAGFGLLLSGTYRPDASKKKKKEKQNSKRRRHLEKFGELQSRTLFVHTIFINKILITFYHAFF